MLKEFFKNKKNIKIILTCVIVLLIAFLFFLIYLVILNLKSNNLYEFNFASNNTDKIFSINKCVFFSSCDTKNKTASASNFTIENLYQYTDMAFFINNNNTELSKENTLHSLSINNIQINEYPSIGEPTMYYKNVNNFAKSDIIDSNLINDQLDFTISSNNEEDFSSPILYNNCANPIVLSYVNSNIKTDYTMLDTRNSSYI